MSGSSLDQVADAVIGAFPKLSPILGILSMRSTKGFRSSRKLALEESSRADLLIEPRLPRHHDMSQQTVNALVDAGERAALEALP